MNPAFYPPESVPLQGRAAGHGAVQVVFSEPPSDYVLWSLYTWLYANPFCLGLAALIYSIKARDRKVVGDMEGAREHGSTARCLNIWATVLTIAIVITVIVLVIVLPKQMFWISV